LRRRLVQVLVQVVQVVLQLLLSPLHHAHLLQFCFPHKKFNGMHDELLRKQQRAPTFALLHTLRF
jgi:hypothetical protein